MKYKRAFTVVELLISLSIFVVMTSLVVAKYGNFNQSVLLTNLSYDIAIIIRTAQAYGLSVKAASDSDFTETAFNYAYGVHFDTDTTNDKNKEIILFADTNSNGIYDASGDIKIGSSYFIKRGAYIKTLYSSGTPHNTGTMDISFKRPDPNSNICYNTTCGESSARIVVLGTDGSTRSVEVYKNGQISVKDE